MQVVNFPIFNGILVSINILVSNVPALEYSDAALSKSGFHLVKLVFKLHK